MLSSAAKWGRCAPAASVLSSLLSLGAGWAQSQLIPPTSLPPTPCGSTSADTTPCATRARKLAVGTPVLALTDEACPADSRADAGRGGGKPRPLRADGPPDTGLSRHPRTGESLPREYVLFPPGAKTAGPAAGGTTRCGWTSGRGGQAGTGGVCSTRVSAGPTCGGYLTRLPKMTLSAGSISSGSGSWRVGRPHRAPPGGRGAGRVTGHRHAA